MPRPRPTPVPMPMSPPRPLMVMASTRNWRRMSRSLAPMALRMPISRVRSVTGHQHDVHDADPADEERHGGDGRQQRCHDLGGLLLGGDNIRQDADLEVVVLARLEAMALAEKLADLVAGLVHERRVPDPHGHRYDRTGVRPVDAEDLPLGRRKRDEDRVVLVLAHTTFWPFGSRTPITVKGTFLIRIVLCRSTILPFDFSLKFHDSLTATLCSPPHGARQ